MRKSIIIGAAVLFLSVSSAAFIQAERTLTHSPTLPRPKGGALNRSPAFQGGDEKRGSGLTPNKPRHSCRGVEGLTAESVADIVKRNVAAAGGEARLAAVRNLSFTAGGSAYYVTPAGMLKIVVQGLPPAVIEVILVERGLIRRNRLNEMIDTPDIEKTRFSLYAKLFGGCFTIGNFAADLRFEGTRRFGPETFYRLSAAVPPMTVEFDLDTAECLLRQVALRGTNPDGSRYEEFFDMGLYQDFQGVKMPSSWFRSLVGGRGNLSEVSDVSFDVPLDRDFFTTTAVNVGEVKVAAGALEGHILALLDQRGSFVLVTNWTPGQAEKAGLTSGANLALRIEDLEREAVFYAGSSEAESANAYQPGARIVTFDPQRGGTFWILFFVPSAEEAAAIKAKVKGLSPVSVRLR